MNHHQALAGLSTAAGWRKSSYSVQNGCVEVTTELPDWVGVRDSKLGPDSPLLAVTPPQWRATLAATQAGELRTA
ncbi:MAG: DUF397 domain-containing protein [Pseudonocardiaceae bacterium]